MKPAISPSGPMTGSCRKPLFKISSAAFLKIVVEREGAGGWHDDRPRDASA